MSGEQTRILSQVSDGVALITLNEPDKRNPMSPELVEQAIAVLESFTIDPAVRAVVLTGAGSAFCSGADLRRMRTATAWEDRTEYSDILRLNQLIWEYPKPTIAAVNGPAYGGGANIVAWCDLAFAVPTAKFAYTEVKAGIPSATVIPTLSRSVGRKRMYEMILTGRPIDADRAAEFGLINAVIDGDVVAYALEVARDIAGFDADAVSLTKEIARVSAPMPYREAIAYAREVRVVSRTRENFQVTIPQGRPGSTGSPS